MERASLNESFQIVLGKNVYNQMKDCMNSFILRGHTLHKVKIIIQGNYTNFSTSYILQFHRDIFYSANTFFHTNKRKSLILQHEMCLNRTARVRIIGIHVEVFSDWMNSYWIIFFRQIGINSIDVKIHHVDNTVLKENKYKHTFEQAWDVVNLLKNNGFKVGIHLMTDLPGSTHEMDKHMFLVHFKQSTPTFCPDEIKVYSYMGPLYESPKISQYAMNLCLPWVGMYDGRYIPIVYNLKPTLEYSEMHSREINLHPHDYNKPKKYFIQHYKSGSGIEYFISLESLDKKVLFGFVRLRLTPSKPLLDGLQRMGLIRELHVYNPNKSKGVGKQLLKYAEWISWMHGKNGVAVMSGEGYRSYYTQLGYSYHETFEIKKWRNIYITLYLILSYVYIILYSYIKYFK